MYYDARTMGYRMAGMKPDAAMIAGMALIGVGLLASLYGLIPADANAIQRRAAGSWSGRWMMRPCGRSTSCCS